MSDDEPGPTAVTGPQTDLLVAFLSSVDADYAEYAPDFQAAGFSKPAQLQYVVQQHVPKLPTGALLHIKAAAGGSLCRGLTYVRHSSESQLVSKAGGLRQYCHGSCCMRLVLAPC